MHTDSEGLSYFALICSCWATKIPRRLYEVGNIYYRVYGVDIAMDCWKGNGKYIRKKIYDMSLVIYICTNYPTLQHPLGIFYL